MKMTMIIGCQAYIYVINLADNAYLRAAWTNSVVRPNFAQSAPGVYIDGDEAEFGNPMLKPLESSNFDLGVEKYFGKASMVGFYSIL